MIKPGAILDRKGFTLVELMLVVTVVSILIAISSVVYTHFLKKARRVEAQGILSALAKQQTSYYVEHDAYTNDPKALGLPTLGNTQFYNISIVIPKGTVPEFYLATAVGNIDNDPDLDEWTIDQDKILLHTKVD
ncbi:MAG: type IV pilin protein [Nitrospiria bacterium]